MSEKPITVAALIEQLRALPQDAYVLTEGCDCTGPCSGARLLTKREHDEGAVLLVRDDTRERS